MTGECLVQKQAEAIMPIASITKLMTAMVVLDSKMDIEESITIDLKTWTLFATATLAFLLIPAYTRDTLLLALMASENRAAHALDERIPEVSRFRCCHECQGQVTGTY